MVIARLVLMVIPGRLVLMVIPGRLVLMVIPGRLVLMVILGLDPRIQMNKKALLLTWIPGSHPQGDAKWIAGSSPAMT